MNLAKPKKKSSWMKGFIIPPRASDIDLVRYEMIRRAVDFKNKQIKASY